MTVACPDCGAIQTVPPLQGRRVAVCHRCDHVLDRAAEPTLTVSLAWSVAVLLLLIPANTLPVMSAAVRGRVHEAHLVSGIAAVWGEGRPVLAMLLGAFILAFPFVWSGARTLVLAVLETEWRPSWLGRLFRYEQAIHLWAIPEVLIVAGFVIYMRTTEQVGGQVELGGWCVMAAGLITVLGRQMFTPHTVWRKIQPDRDPPAGEESMGCSTCDLVLPISMEGRPCPRCGRRLRVRKENSLSRTGALVLAGYLLFFPAYYFPMSYTVQPNGLRQRTIVEGVRELFQTGFWYLGVIVIVASILIPLGKLVGMTWLLVSAHRGDRTRLSLKTHVYRRIHSIGRWSYTDPLIVALTIPLLSFAGIVQVHADLAALPFVLVVAATMLAARSFDPRLLWDAAEGRAGPARAVVGEPAGVAA